MSTLTKILVVLLSLFSIFLCGVVVSYISHSSNYKALYTEQQQLTAYAQAELAKRDQMFNEQMARFKTLEADLNSRIAALEAERDQLAAELRKAERLNVQYQNQAESWKGVLSGFEQSVRNLQQSLAQTQQQLDQARQQGIKDQKELQQLTADLYAKIVQMQAMEAERRRLVEQKAELEKQLLALTGKTPSAEPVTPAAPSAAMPASPMPTAAAIQGLVKEVDQSLVHLSVGSADGVREQMVFHITRGDRFLCDVVITHVDVNQSAGVLQLVRERPKPGDTASTQL